MKIIIQGSPIAKKRPRFVRRGKFVATYNPQETEEGRWLWEAKQQLPEKLIQGPVRMECNFIFARPKSHFGTGRNAGKLKPSAPRHHVQKPDADNLLKWVKDCLNGEAYKDDCQVVEVTGKKWWSEPGFEAKTEITMEEINV